MIFFCNNIDGIFLETLLTRAVYLKDHSYRWPETAQSRVRVARCVKSIPQAHASVCLFPFSFFLPSNPTIFNHLGYCAPTSIVKVIYWLNHAFRGTIIAPIRRWRSFYWMEKGIGVAIEITSFNSWVFKQLSLRVSYIDWVIFSFRWKKSELFTSTSNII